MSRAAVAIERYEQQRQAVGRTRFRAEKDVTVQHDPKLPKVTFYRYPDGTSIRRDYRKGVCELTEF